MDLDEFLGRVNRGEHVRFKDTMSVIQQYFDYHPTSFSSGDGADRIFNEAGANEGSCKIFAFARLHQLSEESTLSLFGHFYWTDVLQNPSEKTHKNIRNFIAYGWAHIKMDGSPLILKK